ncbi:MAG: 50S ribosomal protein L25/general stress protein Ctc [Bacteroidaceae bacterium]|nr:50S ribosomal protein L25/general stress protein Ctc [Bacteroidaceae bacterium]
MKTIDIQGTARAEFGKKGAKELRKANVIPCVLYGVEKDEKGLPVAKAFKVTTEAVRNLVYTPDIHMVNLTIDGTTVLAILKDIQFHPVKDSIMHMDFYQVTEDKPIVMNVPVKLVGLASGVKAGGKLEQILRTLKVKALYTQMPQKIEVDVTKLIIGKTIKVGDINIEGLQFVNSKEAVVCGVMATRNAKAQKAQDGE